MKYTLTETEKTFERLCAQTTECSCKRKHQFSLKKLLLHEGAIKELSGLINELGKFENIVMICDENTYKVAGHDVENMLKVHTIRLNPVGLHANERGVAEAEALMPQKCDLMIAVGSGTIHDITRYIAYKIGVDFISVPTAASVDGFVSNVAAMTWQGAKKTLTAVSPIAMVADSKILAEAPKNLTASGVGDLLGKYVALLDWKIGYILTDEYYCEQIVEMEENALKSLVQNIQDIASNSPKAIETLMYGLVLSGLAMQMAGNSRPASGAEHHISHCIEMEVFNSANSALHGEKVGVATCIVCDVYHKIAKLKFAELGFDLNNGIGNDEIKNVFGKLYEQIIRENATSVLFKNTAEKLNENWDKICALIDEIPTGDYIRKLLTICGGSTTLADIGLQEDLQSDLLRYSPLVRNRLTLMRLKTYFSGI